ncbi:DUF2829 domain-containing protein [Klebsiella michiganensis]|jgi:hypothetical protein|uniref:Thoeris anti-defense Tad2 family protein n=1 Tax=Klebsiella michiganensis TaxID=1134687 RepID=UPI000A485E0D|nr:MW1434 family type I TA system toxin [Klebsiella michiganensis]MBZ7149102.1 DUF2829 domain-containing protein [Klebsiella michiganensis]MEB7678641.1 DUF2829 domain-containing protein [Klebsiella michiganensis]HBM2897084.1 DUF2829 domain-containing protein [Klebsiella michiganensis]
MAINYDEAMEKVKSGNNMRRPAWPDGCYITYNSDTSDDLHPDASIDYVDAALSVTTFSPADFDEIASDWVES